MSIVVTDLRNTRERAGELRYYPHGANTATNVQAAIDKNTDAITAGTSQPPSITPTQVNFAQSPYTIQPTDFLILVDTLGGAVQIQTQLQSTRNGRSVEIKDDTGNASVNNISILRTGPETIDGLTSYPIASDYGTVTLSPKSPGGYAVT